MTARKTLFLDRLARRFKRCVRALKLLKIPIKINKPKKAVMRYISFGPSRNILWINGDFKKKIHIKAEYVPVNIISSIMYLLMIGSFLSLGFSSIYSFNAGSKEKAMPARVSITIFIHSIWITVTGVSTPINGPIIEILTAHRLTVN